LRGFKRIVVPAGKTATAVINLPPAAFEFYDANGGKMTVAAGDYELLYGNSSADKDLKVVKISIK
jgi:beta-glucosidase